MWHLFSRFIIFKIFTYVYLCLYVYVYVFVCPQRPEEGAGGTGSHEPCDMGPGNPSQVLWKSGQCPYCPSLWALCLD